MRDFIIRSREERRLIFEQAEAALGLPARSIEKDFWVCWTLSLLFSLPGIGEHLTFKGGTSLSKAWRLIERFSEDIDIVFDRAFLGFGDVRSPEAAESAKKRKDSLKALRQECSRCIRESLRPSLEAALRESLSVGEGWALYPDPSDEGGQTLLFDYPSCWTRDVVSYVAPAVKIEMGARSDDWPAQSMKITPYVAEAYPGLFQKAACVVMVLAAERTFWEKATLLHEENFRPEDKPRKRPMARHYYDLWCLIHSGVAARAMADQELFDRVVEHRRIFFQWTWMDYSTMKRGSLRIVPLEGQVPSWRIDYDAMRSEMFFGKAPSFEEMLRVVQDFEDEFNRI